MEANEIVIYNYNIIQNDIHFTILYNSYKTVKYVTCHSMNNKTDYGEYSKDNKYCHARDDKPFTTHAKEATIDD